MQSDPYVDNSYRASRVAALNQNDPVEQFLAAMDAAGLTPAEPIAARLVGGDLVRFCVAGDRKGKRNGWAVLHLDGRPAGSFGSWKHGISEKWRADRSEALTPAERRERTARYREQQERRLAERLSQHREAADRCRARWENAAPADSRHPYLVGKSVCGESLRQWGQWLLAPMVDAVGYLWNLQSIASDGTKLFAKGARQSGLFCPVGLIESQVVIGEGYGTVAVIRRATGLPVVAAFSSGNLLATALAIRTVYPDTDIIIAADDDVHLVDHPKIKKNLGMDAASEAAKAVGGRLAVPPEREVA